MFWNVPKEDASLKHKGETRRSTYRINDIVPEQLQLLIDGIPVEIRDISADGISFLFNNDLDEHTQTQIEQKQSITAEIHINVSTPQSVIVNIAILSRDHDIVRGTISHSSFSGQQHLHSLMMEYQKERIRSRKAELHPSGLKE